MPGDFIPAHGGQLRELASEFGIPETSLVDFSASINPQPPSGALVAALCDEIRTGKILTSYPDIHYSQLKQAVASYARVDVSAIAVGNGVMPLLDAAIRSLGANKCLVPFPAFAEYRRVLAACRSECCALILSPQDGFQIDPERLLFELKTCGAQALLLANPQNPSGLLIPAEELDRLREAAHALGATTIVDEAFIDYAPGESLSERAAKSRGLVILRSLTKFFAMPGLRVAFAVAHPQVRAAMDSLIPAWPIDSIAAAAARLALEDRVYISRTRAANAAERDWLADRLQAIGLVVFPSHANFLLVKVGPDQSGHEFWRRLIEEHGVVIRACANFEGLDERYFRVGVRARSENQVLIEGLAGALRSRPVD